MESTLRKGIERRTGNVNQEEQAAYELARVWQSPIRATTAMPRAFSTDLRKGELSWCLGVLGLHYY